MNCNSAFDSYLKARATPRDVDNPREEDLFQTEHWRINNYKTLSEEYNGNIDHIVRRDRRRSGSNTVDDPVSDLEKYETYMNFAGEEECLLQFCPRNTPLKTSLSIDMLNTKSWKQPIVSTDSRVFTLKHVPVANPDLYLIKQHITEFKESISTAQSNSLNSPLLGFSIEYINIPLTMYGYITHEAKLNEMYWFEHQPNDEIVTVPASFVISNGSNTIIEFNLPWSIRKLSEDKPFHESPKEISFTKCEIPDEIVNFWKSLPILYAVDAQSQANSFSAVLRDLFGIDLNLNVIDLKALAVSAGCRMDQMDITTLSIIVLGKAFPADVGKFDSRWALGYRSRPSVMKLYIKKKFLFLGCIYKVLMGLLIRNMFPDPDIVLNATEMTQGTFTSWFCDFVGESLVGADLSETAFATETRSEMIFRLNPDSILTQYFAQLIINVPVCQAGGARYIHHVRNCFIQQYEVLKKIRLPFSKEEKPNQSKDLLSNRYSLLYDRHLDFIDDKHGDPVVKPGLQPSPQFQNSIFALNVQTDEILQFFKQGDRNLVPALEEWARINPDSIPDLFNRLRHYSTNDLTTFWIPRVRLYDKLRLILLRVADSRETVESLDSVITMRRNSVVEHHHSIEKKRVSVYQNQVHPSYHAAKELNDSKYRVDMLSNAVNYSGSAERVGIQNNILELIPGNNTERNRKIKAKRLRRQQRKLASYEHVLPQQEFKDQKRLRTLYQQGLDVELPPDYQPDFSRFVDQEVRGIDASFPGPSTSSGIVSSFRDRHSSGYSTGSSSSHDFRPDSALSTDDLRYSINGQRDLRNKLVRNEDLRDTIERQRDLRESVDTLKDYAEARRNYPGQYY